MAQKAEGGSGLTPEMRKLLQELGRSQVAYREYGNAGRKDLQLNAHNYADSLRSQAQGMGFDLTPYSAQNQFGNNFESWYSPANQGPAGKYDASKDGQSLRPETKPATSSAGPTTNKGPAAPDAPAAGPTTTPLPSSQFKGLGGGQGATQIDWNAITGRATRDAHLQVGNLAQQANQGYDRFASEGNAQIQALQAMYTGQYRQNAEATQLSARDAVQRSASRGFLSSGISADAEQKANLRGEQMRMDLAAQESGQVGQISDRIHQAGQQRNDTLANLSAQEQALIGQLSDQYGQRAIDNNFRQQGQDTQTALSLLGMDTQVNQFNQGMSWDKDKFGQQLNFDKTKWSDQVGQFNQQLAEQIAARLASTQFGYDQLGMQSIWHQNDSQFQRDQLGYQDSWHKTDSQFQRDQLGYQDKWNTWDNNYKTNSLDIQRNGQSADKTWRENQLTLQRDQFNADNWFKGAARYDSQNDKSFAQGQITSKYMDEADWMMAQLKSGNPDPQLAAKGIGNANDIVRWYGDRSMKITSEGGNMSDLLKYIRQRSGTTTPGGPSVNPPGNPFGNPSGNPVTDPKKDPMGYRLNPWGYR